MTIADNLQTLIDCKADMKSAIEEKGVTVSGGLFTYADAIRQIEGGTEIIEKIDFSKLGYNSDEITNCNSVILEEIEFSKKELDDWDPSNTRGYYMETNLCYFPKIDTSNVTNMTNMFYNSTNLTYVPSLNTSKVTSMNSMFSGCTALSKIEWFDTSKVTNMGQMFFGCEQLTVVPHFDTSNVTGMSGMFLDCSLIMSIPHFDTSNVTNMYQMFYDCFNLKTIPQLDTSKVTDMGQMFMYATNLESLPLIDMSNVDNFDKMFGAIAHTVGHEYNNLTDIAGFKNVGMIENQKMPVFSLANCINMTVKSAINIIENLYDRASAGFSTLTLRLPFALNNDISSYYISIATNKGWDVTF